MSDDLTKAHPYQVGNGGDADDVSSVATVPTQVEVPADVIQHAAGREIVILPQDMCTCGAYGDTPQDAVLVTVEQHPGTEPEYIVQHWDGTFERIDLLAAIEHLQHTGEIIETNQAHGSLYLPRDIAFPLTVEFAVDPTDYPLDAYANCSPEHARILRDSAISPEVAQQTAGTRAYTSDKGNRTSPALGFYYHHPDGDGHTVSRLDTPFTGRDGKVIRYLSEKGERGLQAHPMIRDYLHSPTYDLVVVEGTKQTLAAVTALRGRKVAVVGMNGIRGWCWNPGAAPGTPLPDWGHVPLRGRRVFTVPDGDWTTKEGVREGADALDEFMRSMGADVHRVTVPMLAGEDSTGLDDYLASVALADRQSTLLGLMDAARELADDDLFVTRDALDDLPPVEPLIHGMLNKASVVWLSGKFGTYKTFVALGWACSVATGRPWAGRMVADPGTVVYVAAEGVSGLSKRIQAWEQGENGGKRVDRLIVTKRGLDPRRPDHMAKLRQVVMKNDARMVVFDTLHRCTPGFEENSNTEAGEIFGALQQLKDDTGCAVLVLHHTGHSGERARGASSMEDDADDAYVIRFKGDPEDRSPDNLRIITRRKSKEGEAGEEFTLRMVPGEGGAAYVTVDPFDAADPLAVRETPTMRLAKWLDGISAPVDMGRPALKEWVLANGFTLPQASTEVWGGAVRLRKQNAGIDPDARPTKKTNLSVVRGEGTD